MSFVDTGIYLARMLAECQTQPAEDRLRAHLRAMLNKAQEIKAERDTLRQQLAERDATIERLEAGIQRDHWKQMAARKNMIVIVDVEPDTRRTTEYLVTEGHVRAMWKRMESLVEQRDKLAGLLREAHSAGRSRRLTVDELYRIAAALAEVNK